MKKLKYFVLVMVAQALVISASDLSGEGSKSTRRSKRERANSDPGPSEKMPSLTDKRIFKTRRVGRPNFMDPLLIPCSLEEQIDVPLNQLSISGAVLASGEEKDDT